MDFMAPSKNKMELGVKGGGGGGVGGRVYVCLCRRTRSRTHGFLLTDAEQRAESWERYGVRKCGLINLPRGVEGGSGETVGRR